MFIHRRVVTVKEGKTEQMLELYKNLMDQRSHFWLTTRFYVAHPGPEDHPASNLNQIVWEGESESLAADREATAHFLESIKADEKALQEAWKRWHELEAEPQVVEFWTVSDSH